MSPQYISVSQLFITESEKSLSEIVVKHWPVYCCQICFAHFNAAIGLKNNGEFCIFPVLDNTQQSLQELVGWETRIALQQKVSWWICNRVVVILDYWVTRKPNLKSDSFFLLHELWYFQNHIMPFNNLQNIGRQKQRRQKQRWTNT